MSMKMRRPCSHVLLAPAAIIMSFVGWTYYTIGGEMLQGLQGLVI